MVPLMGTLNIRCRTIIGSANGTHNFDNRPYPVRTIKSYRVYDQDMVCWGYQKSSDQLGCAAIGKLFGQSTALGHRF